MKKILISILLSSAAAFTAQAYDVDATKANWERHCSKCHAEDGSAATKLGERLEIKDYTDPASLAELSDEDLFNMTKDGVDGTKMPGYGKKLSDQEIHDLVKYMRAMAE